jgi:YihY family inner membrane protein
MNLRRRLGEVDRFQRRHRALAVSVAVLRKYGEDSGGSLAALIAYRAFFSLFPLLLLLATVLGYVLAGDPGLREEVVDSTLAQFPVIGEQLQGRSLQGSGVALVVGAVGALWAGFGVILASEEALDRIWGVPRGRRAGFVASRLRALGLLVLLGGATIASTAASGLAGGGAAWLGTAADVGVSAALNLAIFLAVYHLLASTGMPLRASFPGAALAAAFWTALQLAGGWFLAHEVRSATPVYGTFALVIGLLVWVQLGATLTVIGAELNAVLARRLWPLPLLR